MLKKTLSLLLLPLLMGGCAATFTNLTPLQQPRNTNNLYTVGVAFNSHQQTLRWDTIQPRVVVGSQFYPMQPTPLMTNRWEGRIPVPPDQNVVRYHYKFDYFDNSFGAPKPDSASSRQYTLHILNQ